MTYSIRFQPKVEKELKPLPKAVLLRVFKAIIALQDDPQPQAAIKLSGVDSLYRIRVGDYRVIYELIDEQDLIIIQHVRHRRDVYRSL